MKLPNRDILFKLLQRFNKLKAEQKDLDFRRSEWARDALIAFGDEENFTEWLQSDLNLTAYECTDMVKRAHAAKAVPDAKTWHAVGGLSAIRKIEHLPRKEQVNILEQAKASQLTVRQVLSDRARENPNPIIPCPTPIAERKRISDVALLAKFIADRMPNAKLPSDIEVIVRMYVPAFGRKRAA